MTQVDFYHLQKQTLDEVLPKLLDKAYSTGKHIKVKIGTDERVEFINSSLWSFEDQAFLPHGTKKDGFAEEQPIWLSSSDDNPNGAVFLFLVDGALIDMEKAAEYERIFNIFDGNQQSAVEQARNFWKTCKAQGFTIHYWQQDDRGKWKQAA